MIGALLTTVLILLAAWIGQDVITVLAYASGFFLGMYIENQYGDRIWAWIKGVMK